mmetsp:Transcript_125273/g.348560  ORF Transcript_125273/g.348560 Transcript_125273/m.348560 type:complete len:548 (-) Transcript_125273:348-1991(-)
MKRVAEGNSGGVPKRSRAPRTGQFAFKVLCPEPLVASVVGSNGATVARIQDESGAHLTFSRRGEYFPESRLRVLVISGTSPNEILAALEQVIEQVAFCGEEERQVLEGAGTLEDDDGDFIDASGEYRLRCALTESAANAAVGLGGQGLSSLSEETGSRILVDSEARDNHQLATLGGNKQQLLAAFERLNSLVQADVEESWFSRWADQRGFPESAVAGGVPGVGAGERGAREGGPSRRGEAGTRPGGQQGCTIFVGGLPQSTEASALRAHFERYGRVVETDVKMDPRTGRSKGFGFVTFSEPHAVDRCFENTEDNVIGGKWVDVKRYGDPGGGDGGRVVDEAPAGDEGPPGRRRPPRGGGRACPDDLHSRGEEAPAGGRDEPPPGRARGGPRWGSGSQRWATPGSPSGVPLGLDIMRFVGLARTVPGDYLDLDYCITCSLPSAQCGALIGRKGENITEVERKTGARVQLSKKDHVSDHRQLSIIGSIMSVYAAHLLLMRDFNDATAPRGDSEPMKDAGASQKIEDLQRQIDMLKAQMGKRRGGGGSLP